MRGDTAMENKDWIVTECTIKEIRDYVEEHHYSHNVNGLKITKCYALYHGNLLSGAIIFGQLSTTSWKKYSDNEQDVVELRRMVITDRSKANVNTWFMSRAIKLLKKDTTVKKIISYADPFYGHVGAVYQASNGVYLGVTNKDVVLVTKSGKRYHSRAMRTKYKGELKPFAKRLKEMYEKGELSEVVVPGKHIYFYPLVKNHGFIGLHYPKKDKS